MLTSSFSNLMAGILPFGAVFIELFFILSVSNQNEVSFLPEVNSCYRNSSLIITSNPFTLLSDQGGVSLYSINTFSRSRVMRKKKCIYIRNRTLFDLVLNSQNKNDKKWMRDSAENVYILPILQVQSRIRIAIPSFLVLSVHNCLVCQKWH